VNIDEIVSLGTTGMLFLIVGAALIWVVVRSYQSKPADDVHVTVAPHAFIQSRDVAQAVEVGRIVGSGLELRYEGGRFVIDGVGEMSADDVRRQDAKGLLTWSSPEVRDWFLESFQRPEDRSRRDVSVR
jgi:hypothetical protein